MFKKKTKPDSGWDMYEVTSLYGKHPLIGDVVEIEKLCYEDSWERRDFIEYLSQPNDYGKVISEDSITHGFMLYSARTRSFALHSIAVHPDSRRDGIGSLMLDLLKRCLHREGRWMIETKVRESNLATQLFFQDNDFRCIGIDENHYPDNEPAYVMNYRIF